MRELTPKIILAHDTLTKNSSHKLTII